MKEERRNSRGKMKGNSEEERKEGIKNERRKRK
jgi:hypothetical protein